MAGKHGTVLVESKEQLFVKKAAQSESGIKCGASMTLGADQTISAGHFGVLGIYIHFLKIQHCQKIRNGKAATNVTHADAAYAFNDIAADVAGYLLQITAQFYILL